MFDTRQTDNTGWYQSTKKAEDLEADWSSSYAKKRQNIPVLVTYLEFRKYKHQLNLAFDSSGQNGHVYPTDQQLHWKSPTEVIHIHMREKTLEFIAWVLSRTK